MSSADPDPLLVRDLVTIGSRIEQRHLHQEIDLMDTKWFAYRYMSPMKATLLFRDAYRKEFAAHIRKEVDRDLADHVHGIRSRTLRESQKEWTQLFLARQRADEMGMPYEFYIRSSLEFGSRRNERDWFPRPNQLHHGDEGAGHTFVAVVFPRWKESMPIEILQMSEVSAYRRDHPYVTPWQLAYRRFLVQAAQDRLFRLESLIQTFYQERKVLTRDDLMSFRFAELDLAIRSLKTNAGPCASHQMIVEPGKESNDRPGCYGLPIVNFDNYRRHCSTCSLHAECQKCTAEVLQVIDGKTGSLTPKDDLRKRQQRERQRRCRERKRAANTTMPKRQPASTPPV